tara:strand:+ start:3456 stop:3707 length:252 start_codon:yes stop_codon:yes gene_type:complete
LSSPKKRFPKDDDDDEHEHEHDDDRARAELRMMTTTTFVARVLRTKSTPIKIRFVFWSNKKVLLPYKRKKKIRDVGNSLYGRE